MSQPPASDNAAMALAASAVENRSTHELRKAGAPHTAELPQPADPLAAIDAIQHLLNEVPLTDPGWKPAAVRDRQAVDNQSLIGVRLLNYQVLCKLGEGGMGAVYQARHLWLDKLVAIKVLPRQSTQDPEAVARFRREARAVGRLDHANIVRANDAGEHEGVHFLVTEHVEGLDLAKLLKGQPPLKVADACEIIRQAAWGLQYAYEQGLVHRDIKPSNIMLARGGAVKVLDFGLARLEDSQSALTSTGCLMGTLDFMAPEQAGDIRHVDIRADIYSLGCTFYFLLTGHAPFGGQSFSTPASKIKAHLADEPPPIRQWRSKVPAEVVECVAKMMAKQRGDRFATPAHVALALTAAARKADLPALLPEEVPNPRRVTPPIHRHNDNEWVTPMFAALGRALTMPFRMLGRLGRGSRSATNASSSSRTKSSSLPFSFSGVFLLTALVAFLWFSGFSCVPIEGEPLGMSAEQGHDNGQVIFFGSREPPSAPASGPQRARLKQPPERGFGFSFGHSP